ncbi:MAG: hypothetical protein ACO3XO_04790 [Bdellovibrionota bacterium]
MSRQLTVLLVLFSLWIFVAHGLAEEMCIYINERGVERKVRSVKQIPLNLRTRARCFGSEPRELADPQEMNLSGAERKERMLTSVGPVNLRWSRSVEKVLGRSPARAMADAGRMVSKTLKQGGFPSEMSTLSLEWDVVFLDETLPVEQVPQHLISNCHPAWMTPPANIYVVAQRVVAGCQGSGSAQKRDVEGEMAAVLAHEMGHVLESSLLSSHSFRSERWRAEGFATFFERLAARYSSLIRADSLEKKHSMLAQRSFQEAPEKFLFRGRAEDYARASMYLQAVVNDRNIRGLIDVYQRMDAEQIGLHAAIEKETGWSLKLLEEKAQKAAGL